MAELLSTLEQALASLAEEQPVQALDLLLAGWRARRAPALAERVEALGAAISRGLPAVEGRTRKAAHEAWLDLAAHGRAADLHRLLAHLLEPPSTHVRVRFERLELRPVDPRLAAALVRMIDTTPYTGTGSRPIWTKALRMLEACGDVRGREVIARKIPALQQVIARHPSQWPPNFETYLVERLAGLLERLPARPPELDAAERARLERIDAAVARLAAREPPLDEAALFARLEARGETLADREARLVAQVTGDPADDAARLVYGDWLAERGDPRGEFIALQFKRADQGLTRAEERRERGLLRRNLVRWLGPIEPAVDRRMPLRFSRGFLSACRARFRTRKQRAELLHHPLWRTVEQLQTPELELLLDERLVSLRRLGLTWIAGEAPGGYRHETGADGLDAATLARICDHGRQLPFEEVCLDLEEPLESAHLLSIGRARALPRLGALHLRETSPYAVARRDARPEALSWLVESPLGGRLERLTVLRGFAVEVSPLAWLSYVRRHCRALRHLALWSVSEWQVHLHRASPGAPWQLLLVWTRDKIVHDNVRRGVYQDYLQSTLDRARDELARLARPLREHVEGAVRVEAPRQRFHADEHELLAAALAPFDEVALPPRRGRRAR